jgi:hypothetical protein
LFGLIACLVVRDIRHHLSFLFFSFLFFSLPAKQAAHSYDAYLLAHSPHHTKQLNFGSDNNNNAGGKAKAKAGGKAGKATK